METPTETPIRPKIWKFRDTTDGNYCFVLAVNFQQAVEAVRDLTTLDFESVDHRDYSEYRKPIILVNKINPF